VWQRSERFREPLAFARFRGTNIEAKVARVARYAPKRLPSRRRVSIAFVRHSQIFENSLPDVASRLALRSLSESKRRGKVGSFRRRGKVGRTSTRELMLPYSGATAAGTMIASLIPWTIFLSGGTIVAKTPPRTTSRGETTK